MYTISAVLLFVAAWYADKKITFKWGWIVPLALALLGGMSLYASGLGQLVSWLALTVFGWVTGLVGMLIGETIDPRMIMGVLAAAAVIVIVVDIVKDHKYNAKARAALVIAPLAAISAGGMVGEWLGVVNTTGASATAGALAALFGG